MSCLLKGNDLMDMHEGKLTLPARTARDMRVHHVRRCLLGRGSRRLDIYFWRRLYCSLRSSCSIRW